MLSKAVQSESENQRGSIHWSTHYMQNLGSQTCPENEQESVWSKGREW